MKRLFCLIVILTFLTTLNSGVRSDNRWYNEGGSVKHYYHWNTIVWKVEQGCSDYEDNDNLSSHAGAGAAQLSFKHLLAASASYFSNYKIPQITGTWYLRAQLNHDWATDEEPFEKDGDIEGRPGGMSKYGSQSDTDWFNVYDPIWTFPDCDAYAKAEVSFPGGGKAKAVAYSPAWPNGTLWLEEQP